jgi:predicted  nucleic acid-binding Zn-ribbon protein
MTFACMECGRKFKTVKAAERASNDGCPGCGGVDIDIDVAPVAELNKRSIALTAKRAGMDPNNPRHQARRREVGSE